MNKKSVIFAFSFFLLFAVIGYLLNNQRYLNNRLSSLSFITSKQQLFLTPTSAYKNDQKFEDLIWKKYYSQNLGVSFEYPDNLKNYLGPEHEFALEERENGVNIISGMVPIFQVGKFITNENIEIYLKEYECRARCIRQPKLRRLDFSD